MTVNGNVLDLIGNTPLVRLRHASEQTGCEILGKCEFLNPGQSVKDRAALFIIQDAIARGTLRPGGVVVDGTAGNTGIGLAMVANVLGMRTVIVIPETQSQEKKDTLRALGADLVEVPAVPYRNPNNYVKVSGRMADKLAASEPHGAIWANQFDNVANRRAHVETTGPEIWDQTGGKVDGFICAVGTGGTLAGVAEALRARNPQIAIGLADPPGAALFSYYTNGELKAEGGSIVGETTADNKLTENTFVIWRGGEPADFELKVEFRINSTNSGIQFRSVHLPAGPTSSERGGPIAGKWVLKGYQADIDFTNQYTGQIYEERGRTFLASPLTAAATAITGTVTDVRSLAHEKVHHV